MARVKSKKCKHPSRPCLVFEGSDFCSPQCEAVKDKPDIDCRCAHSGCRGSTQ